MALIEGTGGGDELEGTEQDDEIYGFGGTDTINALGGDDYIEPGEGGYQDEDSANHFDTTDAGAGDDTVLVTWRPDFDPAYHRLQGGAGTDTLIFDARAMDFVDFQDANSDGHSESASHQTLYRLKYDGFERLIFHGTPDSFDFDDRVRGLSGNDQLFTYGGTDRLFGGDGDDYLDGGHGIDEMHGEGGDDVMIVDSQGEGAFGGAGIDMVRSSATHALRADTENLTLTGNAPINGGGNALDNIIRGNDAANTLTGNDGDDLLDGRGGADTMRGGLGNDDYLVTSSGDQVQESSAAGGTDTVSSSVSFTLGLYVEHLKLVGTSAIDGTGNNHANQVSGNGNANILIGLGGNDILKGNGGVDRLEGGTDGDFLYGGLGNDVLRGDAGADRFYFHTAPNSATNRDRIEDFNPADDAIWLQDRVFTGLAGPGTLSAAAFRNGTAAADASDRIIYDRPNGNIFYDADGTGPAAQILFATVTDNLVLTNADFIVF